MKKMIIVAVILCICLCICACNGNSQEVPTSELAHTHNYGQWKTSKAATCTEDGEEKRTCECGSFETKSIDKLAHTEIVDKAVAPTCTETGLTEGKHCSVCNTVTVKQETVKAKGHAEVVDKAVAPTCTMSGWSAGKHCFECKTVTVKQEKVKAKGHTEVIDKAVAPTCTKTGLTEGKHCSACNTVIVKQETVKAKGHTEVIDKAVAPTCTKTGLTEGKHCSACNTVIIEQKEIPAAHNDPYGICTICNKVTDKQAAINYYVDVDTSLAQGKTCTTYYNYELYAQYYISYVSYDVSIMNTADGKICIDVNFQIDASVIKSGSYYSGTGFMTYVISLNNHTLEARYTSVSYGYAEIGAYIILDSIEELYAYGKYPCFFVNVGDYYF